MEEKYYRVVDAAKPSQFGIVLKVEDNKLNCLTGGQREIDEYKCLLDSLGNLRVLSKSYYFSLDKSEALEWQEKSALWALQMDWIAPDQTLDTALANVPGTPPWTRWRAE